MVDQLYRCPFLKAVQVDSFTNRGRAAVQHDSLMQRGKAFLQNIHDKGDNTTSQIFTAFAALTSAPLCINRAARPDLSSSTAQCNGVDPY